MQLRAFKALLSSTTRFDLIQPLRLHQVDLILLIPDRDSQAIFTWLSLHRTGHMASGEGFRDLQGDVEIEVRPPRRPRLELPMLHRVLILSDLKATSKALRNQQLAIWGAASRAPASARIGLAVALVSSLSLGLRLSSSSFQPALYEEGEANESCQGDQHSYVTPPAEQRQKSRGTTMPSIWAARSSMKHKVTTDSSLCSPSCGVHGSLRSPFTAFECLFHMPLAPGAPPEPERLGSRLKMD